MTEGTALASAMLKISTAIISSTTEKPRDARCVRALSTSAAISALSFLAQPAAGRQRALPGEGAGDAAAVVVHAEREARHAADAVRARQVSLAAVGELAGESEVLGRGGRGHGARACAEVAVVVERLIHAQTIGGQTVEGLA